jgi:fructokinase
VIVVAGEALVDLVIAPDGTVTAALGGAPFNTARAAGRLGSSVQFLGAVSRDRFGSLLLEQLVSDGVGVDFVARTEYPTTLAAAELDPAGGAGYRFYVEGTSAPQLTDADVRSVTPIPDVLFTGGLALVLEPMVTSVSDMIDRLPHTTAVVIDVNCRPSIITDRSAYVARVERILRRVDVLKVSDEDLDYLLPGVEPSVAADQLVHRGPAAVVVTRGARATLIATTGGQRDLPAPTTGTVIDTIGAGDTFGGALLTAWTQRGGSLSGLPAADLLDELTSVVAAAQAAAAVVVTRRGADPPWRHELPDNWAAPKS